MGLDYVWFSRPNAFYRFWGWIWDSRTLLSIKIDFGGGYCCRWKKCPRQGGEGSSSWRTNGSSMSSRSSKLTSDRSVGGICGSGGWRQGGKPFVLWGGLKMALRWSVDLHSSGPHQRHLKSTQLARNPSERGECSWTFPHPKKYGRTKKSCHRNVILNWFCASLPKLLQCAFSGCCFRDSRGETYVCIHPQHVVRNFPPPCHCALTRVVGPCLFACLTRHAPPPQPLFDGKVG